MEGKNTEIKNKRREGAGKGRRERGDARENGGRKGSAGVEKFGGEHCLIYLLSSVIFAAEALAAAGNNNL